MRRTVTVDFDPDDLVGSVGPAAYAKALLLLERGAVGDFRWDPTAPGIVGKVDGSHGEVYATTALFSEDEPEVPGHPVAYVFDWGECSCPVGFDCKHVAALVLAAAGRSAPTGTSTPAEAEQAGSWEQTLQGL